jgi:hypothetical protein
MRLRKRAQAARDVRAAARSTRNAASQKPPFHRHFSRALNFLRAGASRKVFSLRVSPMIACRKRLRAKARDLHTKLSGVTVIFFLL